MTATTVDMTTGPWPRWAHAKAREAFVAAHQTCDASCTACAQFAAGYTGLAIATALDGVELDWGPVAGRFAPLAEVIWEMQREGWYPDTCPRTHPDRAAWELL